MPNKLFGKINQIINEYKCGKSIRKIAKIFNVGHRTILYHLIKNNIPRRTRSQAIRKYEPNEYFFDKIDTQEKAYFLGFLYADGYHDRSNWSVQLCLQEKDKEILEKLRDLIYNDRPLIYVDRSKHKYKSNSWWNKQNTYGLYICNQHISNILFAYGLVPNKSLILEWPKCIPDYLIRHFIRGYFDGDGSVSKSLGEKRLTLNILGTFNFISKTKYFIEKDCNIKLNKIVNTKGSIKVIQTNKLETIKQIYKYFYKDSILYLKRKKEIFDNFFNLYHINV
ncbi:MAG: LAGLIDADG family homing endonuclease [Nanoarchaeota archaeon]